MKQANTTEADSQTQPVDLWLPEGRWGWLGEKGEGTKKYTLVVTEQSQECKVQYGEYGQ